KLYFIANFTTIFDLSTTLNAIEPCGGGFTCTDEWGFAAECVPKPPVCATDAQCRSDDGIYEGYGNSADCGTDFDGTERCDCDSDAGCATGYRCFDTTEGNDVCMPR
ncbi:MAG: hypothetical protein CO073_00985, partial [Candidatus Komeilibacteria bacterium CG_4_9_14_0_8_um_filter_36_9]